MLGERIASWFKKGPTGETIPDKEEAFSADSLIQNAMFTQYNPDELLTRKGHKVYKRMMTDEQVKAVIRFHRDAVTGREWSFEDHPGLTEEENQSRKELLTEIIRKMPGSFKTRMDMVMSSLGTGFSLVE